MSFQSEDRLQKAEERKAANWASVRRMGRFYFWAAMLPLLLLLWFAGYGYGLLTACPVNREMVSKESSNVQ